MDRQIVDPDPGKNYNTPISAGVPHFKMEKRNTMYTLQSKNLGRLQIVMLDDKVISRKSLVRF